MGLLLPKQGIVQGAGEDRLRVEEGTHSSQQASVQVGSPQQRQGVSRNMITPCISLPCSAGTSLPHTPPELLLPLPTIHWPGTDCTAALSAQGWQQGQAGPTWGPDDKQSQTASCSLPASGCWGDGATSPTRPAWTAGERRGATMKPRGRSTSRSGPEAAGLAGGGPWTH